MVICGRTRDRPPRAGRQTPQRGHGQKSHSARESPWAPAKPKVKPGPQLSREGHVGQFKSAEGSTWRP